MNKLALLDPDYTNFQPKTCEEAVTKFYRIKKQGISNWNDVPKILISLAADLDQTEHDKFFHWITNPAGEDYSNVVPESSVFPVERPSSPDEKCDD